MVVKEWIREGRKEEMGEGIQLCDGRSLPSRSHVKRVKRLRDPMRDKEPSAANRRACLSYLL